MSSSFYGRGGTGGGGGTSNYDDLRNTPVKNLKGSTQSRYVNLSGLEPGHYSLLGYYKYDASSEMRQAIEPLDLIVYRDEATGRTVAQYFSIEEDKMYTNLVSFQGGSVHKASKTLIGGGEGADIYWGDI